MIERKLILNYPIPKRREVFRLKKKLEKANEADNQNASVVDFYFIRQLYYLKQIVSKNRKLIVESLVKKKHSTIPKLYEEMLEDDKFLKLLVGESITNRLDKACKNGKLPLWLIEKIDMCALAFVLYYQDFLRRRNNMFDVYFEKEEDKAVFNTLKKFGREAILMFCCGLDWMSEDRRSQYEKLSECVSNYQNAEFLIQCLVDVEDTDNFTKVSQIEFVETLLSDKNFIALISGQSLTNRIVKVCKTKRMYTELKYRIRQCAWAYIVGCKEWFRS